MATRKQPKSPELDQAILAYKADLKGQLDEEIARLESLHSTLDAKMGHLDTVEKFLAERSAASDALNETAKELDRIKEQIKADHYDIGVKAEALKVRELKIKAHEFDCIKREDALQTAEKAMQAKMDAFDADSWAAAKDIADRQAALALRESQLEKREDQIRQIAGLMAKIGA